MKKKSKQRDAIIRALKNTTSHPGAEWIYQRVKKEIPNIGLATVYRNLRLLKESGDISEIRLSDETARFDGNNKKHYHFRCDRCGRVFDIDEPVDTGIESRIAQKTGFRVTRRYMEFGGECQDCQKLESHGDSRIQPHPGE